jgi:hypothetical protein
VCATIAPVKPPPTIATSTRSRRRSFGYRARPAPCANQVGSDLDSSIRAESAEIGWFPRISANAHVEEFAYSTGKIEI